MKWISFFYLLASQSNVKPGIELFFSLFFCILQTKLFCGMFHTHILYIYIIPIPMEYWKLITAQFKILKNWKICVVFAGVSVYVWVSLYQSAGICLFIKLHEILACLSYTDFYWNCREEDLKLWFSGILFKFGSIIFVSCR